MMKKIIACILSFTLAFTGLFCFNISSFASAKTEYAYDCVAYARARVREYWGIELHGTGITNGYYGAHGFYYNAASFGDTVSGTPAVGALAVWTSNYNPYGHVAFVESVNGSNVTYSEGGFDGHYNESTRNAASMSYSWYDSSLGMTCTQTFLGYVYIKGTAVNSYYLDVNCALDGIYSGSCDGNGTFDVYINGSLVANDVSDYYTAHKKGTTYEIKDIKASMCRLYTGNESYSGTLNAAADVRLSFETAHIYDFGTVTKEATCTDTGIMTYSCVLCGSEKNETIDALGHDYFSTYINATCTENAKETYTCTRCFDTYDVDLGETAQWSEWSTEKPDIKGVAIESKTQYRYSDKETKLTTESELEGWEYVGSKWSDGEKHSASYVTSWPAGFDKNNSLYAQYNKAAPVASSTDTKRVELGSVTTQGYIYWHWCSSYYNGSSPINRLINDGYTAWDSDSSRPYDVFHAFYSTEYKGLSLSAGAVDYWNSDACNQTYWWQSAIPVMKTEYTVYELLNEFTRNTEFTDWSDEVVTASDTRTVETRTVYRYSTDKVVATGHTWDDGTKVADGATVYICKQCGETTKVQLDVNDPEVPTDIEYTLGDVNSDGNINASDARLALRISAKLETPDEKQKLAADVIADGIVAASDARKILRVSAKLETL